MTTDSQLLATGGSHRWVKRAYFGVLGLLVVYVVLHNERFIVDHAEASWAYYFPVRWWLLPHGIAGAVALLAGPAQFSGRLRLSRPGLHRALGRCYLAGVAISAPMAVVVTMLHNPVASQIAIVAQSSLWFGATALAVYYILHRRYEQHRHWMIRSYAITLIFVTDRIVDAIPGMADLDADTSPTVLWLCNLAAWVVPSVLVSTRRWGSVPAPASRGGTLRSASAPD